MEIKNIYLIGEHIIIRSGVDRGGVKGSTPSSWLEKKGGRYCPIRLSMSL